MAARSPGAGYYAITGGLYAIRNRRFLGLGRVGPCVPDYMAHDELRGLLMRILDMSAGNRAIWFNKQYPGAVYVDLLPEVGPDVVCDTRNLPASIGADFLLIVFDPPHVNFGANAAMSKTYGHHTTADIRDIIKGSAKEAHRVSLPDALMAFKWNDHDQSFTKVLALMSEWWEPLFGHKVASKTKHSSSTQWVMLKRKP